MKYKNLIATAFSLTGLACSPEANLQRIERPTVGPEVINGTKAESYAAFSSTVALAHELYGSLSLACSGTLIEPDVVLTAAHCVDWYEASNMKIIYGTTNANNPDEGTVHDVKAVAYHESYDPYAYKKLNALLAMGEGTYSSMNVNDIGIILLEEPIPNAVTSKIYDGEIAINMIARLVGYGQNGSVYNPDEPPQPGDEPSGVLYWGDVPVKLFTEKEIIFGENYPQGNNGSPGSNPDGCYGDSGGPTFNLNQEKNIDGVITATSRVPPDAPWIGCGFGYVATRAAYYKEWIEIKVEELRNLPDPIDAGIGGFGGSAGSGGGGFAGEGGGGVGGGAGEAGCGGSAGSNTPEKDAGIETIVEKEDFIMLDRPGCNFAEGSAENGKTSLPWLLAAALLGIGCLRRKNKC